LLTTQFTYASNKNAKLTIKVIGDDGNHVENAIVSAGFEKNYQPKDSVGKRSETNSDGNVEFSESTSGYITFGAKKYGYYNSHSTYVFTTLGMYGWEPWNKELTILLRKIENPVPMYARNTKFSKIKIPVVGKDIGFDLIRCDWVAPYGDGEYSDFLVNLTSMVENVNNYDFTATIKFEGYNGFIKYNEDVKNGSQYKLPRFAPESGYEKILKTYDRTEKGKNRDVSWNLNQHYMFRTRSVVDKDNKFKKAMHGKIVGDIHLGPQRDGTAYIEFKYYLNPDYTRNLEFDPKRNLFGNLPNLEQVNEP
jgi:hypothetical protein